MNERVNECVAQEGAAREDPRGHMGSLSFPPWEAGEARAKVIWFVFYHCSSSSFGQNGLEKAKVEMGAWVKVGSHGSG